MDRDNHIFLFYFSFKLFHVAEWRCKQLCASFSTGIKTSHSQEKADVACPSFSVCMCEQPIKMQEVEV